MVLDINRAKCFKRGGWDPMTDQIVVQFSDNSIYAYSGLQLNQWILWKDAYPRGTYFNHMYRWSSLAFKELNAWPDQVWYDFEET